jgi:hypothetical protein
MRKGTLIVVVLIAAVLVTVGVVLRSDGGGAFTEWLKSVHGTPRH